MDLKLNGQLLRDCSEALGVSENYYNTSVKHLRALRTSRGAAMFYRSKAALIGMGYDKNLAEVASKSFLSKP